MRFRGRDRRLSDTPESPARTPGLLLGFLGAVFALRLLYLEQLRRSPLGDCLLGDLRVYQQRALEILNGDLVGSAAPFYSSTLYPYLLAAIYRVAGIHPIAVYVLQALLGTATCWLVYRLGVEIFDSRRAAVAGAMAAFYGPFVFAEGQLLMISWTVFAVTATLLLAAVQARTGRLAPALACGAACGLAAADKPNLLVLGLIVPVWWSLRPRRPDRPRVAAVVALAAGIGLVLLPIVARNAAVTGGRVLLTASTGINLAIGNNREADGTFKEPWAGEAHDALRLYDLEDASQHFAALALGHPVTASETDRYWRRAAVAYAAAHPLDEARLIGRKILLLVNRAEITNVLDYDFYREKFGALRLFPVGFWLVGPLGLLGALAAARRGGRRPLLLLLTLLLYGASIVAIFVCDRFRLPAVPILILFAADAAVGLYDTLRSRAWRSAAPSLAGVVAAALIVFLPLAHHDSGRDHWLLAHALEERGDAETALLEYRAAVAARPEMGEVWNNMGALQLRLGRLEEARSSFETAVKVSPGLAYPRKSLADLLRARGSTEAAMKQYQGALAIDPSLVDAWLSLARLHYDRGEVGAARAILEKGGEMNPGAPRFAEILRSFGAAHLTGADDE